MSLLEKTTKFVSRVTGHGIDDLKSAISRKGGVAKSNYFAIYMEMPLLNLNAGSIATNILAGNTSISQIYNDPRDVTFLCESCAIPGRGLATAEYASGRHAIKMPYGFINEDVTFSFILTEDYHMKHFFDEWQARIMTFDTNRLKYRKNFTTDITIVQLSSNGTPIYTVKLENAYPVTVNSIELNTGNENTVQKLNVAITYENFKESSLSDLGSDIIDGITSSVTDLF
jgi:hypothetical protein|tara:strand:- start:6332 stop:7015 length:684 start_codon:yes stop_codon:yes gene_type:complete